jgi:hypothetical protein
MSSPLSIRFDPAVLERLRRKAREIPGATPSGLAQRLVDEGLRMAEHPQIVFKDGPAGRRAALRIGPDIWEIVKFMRELDKTGKEALDATVEASGRPESDIRAALRYYAEFHEEIDAEIADRDRYADEAYEAWLREQKLLG